MLLRSLKNRIQIFVTWLPFGVGCIAPVTGEPGFFRLFPFLLSLFPFQLFLCHQSLVTFVCIPFPHHFRQSLFCYPLLSINNEVFSGCFTSHNSRHESLLPTLPFFRFIFWELWSKAWNAILSEKERKLAFSFMVLLLLYHKYKYPYQGHVLEIVYFDLPSFKLICDKIIVKELTKNKITIPFRPAVLRWSVATTGTRQRHMSPLRFTPRTTITNLSRIIPTK